MTINLNVSHLLIKHIIVSNLNSAHVIIVDSDHRELHTYNVRVIANKNKG